MSRYPEDDLQMAVAQYLDLRGWLWCHVGNERKTTPQAGARLKRKGVKPGVPDVLIFEDWNQPLRGESMGVLDLMETGHGIAIELKAGKNSTTKHQDHWLRELRARGWKTAVCRTIDEVIEATECIR